MAADSNRSLELGLAIGVGASAGGVEALTTLVAGLAPDLPAAVFVVLHLPASSPSLLPQILDRAGPLRAAAAINGERVVAGRIYVAPPDRHLLVQGSRIRLTRGPRANGHRPAVDSTFASLASTYGTRAIGVVLSGALDDGSRGLFELKMAGGLALVQDPQEAQHPGMIESAQRLSPIDDVLPARHLAVRLNHLAQERNAMTAPGYPDPPTDAKSGTRYTCPDCGGVLWRHEQGPSLRFVCSVGHFYSPESLHAAQGDDVEASLWAAARILGDRRTLLAEMAAHAEAHGRALSAQRYLRSAAEAESAAAAVRSLIETVDTPADEGSDRPPEGE